MDILKKTFIIIAAVTACSITVSAQKRVTHREYIEKHKDLAIKDMEIYCIPASITMAQGLLESDCGNSRLATEANNHFGIKCKKDWAGPSISHDDDAKGECFRKYTTVEESYRDHSEFLDKSPRYQSLFELEITDYKGWAHGLKACGYATNPKYAHLLIKLIEDHELYLLDTGVDYAMTSQPREQTQDTPVLTAPSEKIDIDNYTVALHQLGGYPVYSNNGSEFIIANEGDTYAQIASLARISEKRIHKFNDVDANYQPQPGEQVYIRSKANKATNGKLMHVVKEGETMHSISQIYGIKLKKLSKLNQRPVNSRLSVGQQIRLM